MGEPGGGQYVFRMLSWFKKKTRSTYQEFPEGSANTRMMERKFMSDLEVDLLTYTPINAGISLITTLLVFRFVKPLRIGLQKRPFRSLFLKVAIPQVVGGLTVASVLKSSLYQAMKLPNDSRLKKELIHGISIMNPELSNLQFSDGSDMSDESPQPTEEIEEESK